MSKYTTEGIGEFALTLFPGNFKGVCVDVGAGHPFIISNSLLFEKIGWDVYCIEPNPHYISLLKKNRKNVYPYACGDRNEDDVDLFVYNIGGETFEMAGTGLIRHDHAQNLFTHSTKANVRTLDWLMENEIKQDHIDFLSIDVEWYEMFVLRGTNLNLWNPKVIAIEDITDSLEQSDWLKEKNYTKINRFNVCNVYTRDDK